MSSSYNVEITGEAAEEVDEAVKSGAASVGAVVSDAFAAKKWIRENAKAGRLYLKEGSKFREVTPGK